MDLGTYLAQGDSVVARERGSVVARERGSAALTTQVEFIQHSKSQVRKLIRTMFVCGHIIM